MAETIKFWRGDALEDAPNENGYLAHVYGKGLYLHNGTAYQLIANLSEDIGSITNDEIDAICGATIYNINEVEL